MFDHVEFPVGDIRKSRDFYAAVLAELGVEEFFFDARAKSAGFGTGDITGLLIFEAPLGPRRMHLCFTATSREQVDKAYAAGITSGAPDNGPPGYRPQYASGYYAAYLLDPDGNNVEVLFRDRDMV